MRRATPAVVVALALAAVGACGGSTAKTTPGAGDDRTLAPVALDGVAPDARAAAAAAPIVTRRLARLGAPAGTTAVAQGTALRLSTAVDAVLREAAGRRAATELRTITATAVGACSAASAGGGGAGAPSVPAGRRCYTLGPRLAGVEAIGTAVAQLQDGIGWSVALTVQAGAPYAALRAALSGTAGRPVAVVTDGAVVAAIDASSVLGLHDRIGPGMTEREARRLAAALLVGEAAPGAFAGPSPDAQPQPGPLADKDFWLAALSAHVCGAWLPDAPATPDASGIHSHGDGFVYAHPSSAGEAEANATIGRWLQHGSWSATAAALTLWDGAAHRNGDACPDGRVGTVRWWVDGVEQHGDAGAHRIGNGEAITLSFDAAGADPGPPPAAARLPLPRLSPEA